MKTMIRIATAVSALLFVLATTHCSPNAYVVHDVYRYHYRDSNEGRNYNQGSYSTTHYGNVDYAPYGTPARSFVPVEGY
jgi:hypothetical protein